jgi:hypothetical protein
MCRVCHDISTFQPSMSQCMMTYPLFASNYPRYDIGHTHIWIRCCAPAVNLPTCTADSLTSTTNTLTHACTANKQMSTHKLSPYAKLNGKRIIKRSAAQPQWIKAQELPTHLLIEYNAKKYKHRKRAAATRGKAFDQL